MFDKLLKVANLYDEGLTLVQSRREQWLRRYEGIREHLKLMAKYLNENARYKQGFFVDTLHAFNEDIRGTSSKMPSLTFRSGSMPVLVTFRNSMGERKTYSEEGFSISFTPTIAGQILVLLRPHYSDIDQDEPEYSTIAIIEEPEALTNEVVTEIVTRGMEAAFFSSFTGMTRLNDEDGEQALENKPIPRNPIGFKRYETTEKVQ